jgi:hypothetical protein
VFNFNTDIHGNYHVKDIGGPHHIWAIPTKEKVVVDFNMSWQPTAIRGIKFRRLGGKYIRSGKFVGISNPNWKRIAKQKKEDTWTMQMVCRISY